MIYVVCPCCGRSERAARIVERSVEHGGSFWSLNVAAGLGRPTREETAAAKAAGLKHAPNRGFQNKVKLDVPPDDDVRVVLIDRAKAFLKAMGVKKL